MYNKGLIKLFAFLFGIVSIYQLSYTFISSKIENEAATYAASKISESDKDFASKREALEIKYLDSIGSESVFGFTSYNEAKKKELNKGLDLKGGINVTLQIKIKDILSGLANNTKNPVFLKSLEDADEASKSSDKTYVDLFFEAFDANKGDTKLASPDIFFTKSLSEEIKTMDASDEQVKSIIRKKIDESVESAFEVLRERIDGFGVTQPNIQREGTSGRILVELPGAKDKARAQELLSSTAQLEFWETYPKNDPNVMQFINAANEKLRSLVDTKTATAEDTESKPESEIDSLLSDVTQDSLDVASQINPLGDLIKGIPNSFAVAEFAIKDTAKVNEYLNMPEIKRLIPNAIQHVKFAWERPSKGSEVVGLFALKGNRDNTPKMSGDVVSAARAQFDQFNRPAVGMDMNVKGAKQWQKFTSEVNLNQTGIAVVLDNRVYTAPGCSVVGGISGGSTEISGDFTITETKDIANVLRAGKLPARADIIQSEVVGPSLGHESINSGLMSFLIAMALVLVWMIFYYGKAGVAADIALLLNILLIFGVLVSLDAVLTLPGIAGIVLTIGMSVDANVLIFERIKEELAKGKGQSLAISDGFGNALSSILDANITTGLTAIILFIFGSGPIKGFATTLLIGIATSLFTAIFVTRLFIEGYTGAKGKVLEFCTGLTRNLFKNLSINFLKKRKIAYIFSGALIVIALFSLLTTGLQQGVDFVGGRTYQVRFDQSVNTSEISSNLTEIFGSGTNVKTFGEDNQIMITTSYKVDAEDIAVDEEIQEKLFTSLQNLLPSGLTLEEFNNGGTEDVSIGILKSKKVGPTIADDIKKNAVWAILGSLFVVFLYILFRFRKWQFSLGAVVAVFHDVLVVLGVFSLLGKVMPFNMEIDQAFIAAILTVIGYSLNDTVVVFDRIREIVKERGWSSGDNVGLALNSTLSRTLNTSLTTLVVLLAIFIFGGESLRGFMFAMIIGVIVGTYSSLFIATPVMFDTLKKRIQSGKEDVVVEDKE
ncbi:protein translocase subunit SecDF [Cellulophaga lytica]|uniref:protein translocase subunit SecDF n=1 Tax=Cellulophaga lytica TaxID=979 RepID=UPI0004F83DB4|nr:protein translocase subunit SecDF [Cellulophaga lytica]AIM61109.1 preprotein translocase subunit SecD [Cellulophaga lytica]SNQ42401.1 Protein-export membrane protein secD [Cellulophaga lytica]